MIYELDSIVNQYTPLQIHSISYTARAIRGTSGLKYLKDRGWLRRLYYLHKVESTEVRSYLHELIPPIQGSHRNPVCLQGIYLEQIYLQTLFHISALANEIDRVLISNLFVHM